MAKLSGGGVSSIFTKKKKRPEEVATPPEVVAPTPVPTPQTTPEIEQLKQRAEIQRTQPELSAIAEQAKAKGVPVSALQSKGQLKEAGFGKVQSNFQQQALQKAEGVVSAQELQAQERSLLTQVEQPTDTGIPSGTEAPTGLVGKTVETVAQIYDVLRSGLTSTKQTDVKVFEAGFADAQTLINKQVGLVSQGLIDPTEVEKQIIKAQITNNNLASTAKGLGKFNLGYWLGRGKEIETQVAINREILSNMRLSLQQATLQGRQAQVNALAGVAQ